MSVDPTDVKTNRIQVQVIAVPGRESFRQQCLESLSREPVTVDVYSYGSHLQTRLDFIDAATCEYVSFVDDDDIVVEGTFGKLLAMVDSAELKWVVGAHSHEAYIDSDGNLTGVPAIYNLPFDLEGALVHMHLPKACILRTDIAKEVSKFIRSQSEFERAYLYPEFTICALAGLLGAWLELPEVGYLYRQHVNNSTRTMPHSNFRSFTRKLVLRAKDELAKIPEQEPKSWYVRRDVLNKQDILNWLNNNELGLSVALDTLHMTFVYSRTPFVAPDPDPSKLTIPNGEYRVKRLGDDKVVVLEVDHAKLQPFWQRYIDAGASWDYEKYTPHITLTYNGDNLDLSSVTSYTGYIILGPEIQEDLKTDWIPEVT